ncbi:MAG: lipoate--protein ligase family protein [Planctomycetota bacterium]|nr:MAG: lipoate--protein ligase family protein [Planctomycetota bacterium]
MYHLPLTLDMPAWDLALDEALLDAAVSGESPGEVLRIWEPRGFFVVLGRSSPAEREVRLAACQGDGVPLVRRPSGGATVVAGPGCLMYALVLDLGRRPELKAVDRAHALVLGRLQRALQALDATVARAGTSDLATSAGGGRLDPPRKFSGNSMRLKRQRLLYHGTILYDFPLERVGRWLGDPVRRPAYRGRRDHGAFLTNLAAPRSAIVEALRAAWQADAPLADWPRDRTQRLAATRYATIVW